MDWRHYVVASVCLIALPVAADAQSAIPAGATVVGPSIQLISQSPDVLPNRYQFVLVMATHASGKLLQFSIDNAPSWTSFWSYRGVDKDMLMVYGTPTDQNVGVYDFRLLASDGEKTTSQPVQFVVAADMADDSTISWAPPTENEDGSRLGDLSGYRYYVWPPDASLIVGSNSLVNRLFVGHLRPGLWKVAVTALNSKGAESRLSPVLPFLVREPPL
jgi:hypothetical protein